MYTRITTFRIHPGRWDDHEWGFKKAAVAGRNDPGLYERWLVRSIEDPDTGFLLSLWDGMDSIRAYVEAHHLEEGSLPLLDRNVDGEYNITHGEVRMLYNSVAHPQLTRPRW